jgi:hypothetical protein
MQLPVAEYLCLKAYVKEHLSFRGVQHDFGGHCHPIDCRGWCIKRLALLADSVAKPYTEAFVTAARTASGCFHPEDERQPEVG